MSGRSVLYRRRGCKREGAVEACRRLIIFTIKVINNGVKLIFEGSGRLPSQMATQTIIIAGFKPGCFC